MKAARRRNSGTGDLENGWNKLSGVSLKGGLEDPSSTTEASLGPDLELKSLTAEPWVRIPLGLLASCDMAGAILGEDLAQCSTESGATIGHRRDERQRPQTARDALPTAASMLKQRRGKRIQMR